MAGKFLSPAGIQDTILSERRANSRRRRQGLTRHPIHGFMCGCSARCCGGFHIIRKEITIPTPQECRDLLRKSSRSKHPDRTHARPMMPGQWANYKRNHLRGVS